jgi:transposase
VFRQRTFAGLDVHARSVIGHAVDELTGEVQRRLLPSDPSEVCRWLESLPQPVKAAYEAGPTGYRLARFLWGRGIECVVGAPSKLQRPPGNRIKTDARDAEHLCRLLQLDQIVEVTMPSPEQEQARDLVRAREAVRGDLMRARHRVSKMLLRQGIVYPGRTSWTGLHHHWLHLQHFGAPSQQLAYENYLEAVLLTTDRRDRLDKAIEAMAVDSSYTPLVRRLCCLRGISTLTGFALAVEIADWHRFTGSAIGAFLGLVPTEESSGNSRYQGSITKTGNRHARRLLVEAAWHHRKSYACPSKIMRQRWELAPGPARVRGHQGNRRLHQRWRYFQARKKPDTIAAVAIARELAGWVWSLAIMDD